MIERHYFKDILVKSFEFKFDFLYSKFYEHMGVYL